MGDDRTRTRLIQAGIVAFAEKGLFGASLRAINVAADAKNTSSILYHFGDRAGFIKAVIAHIARYGQEDLDAFAAEFAKPANPLSYELARFVSPLFLIWSREPWGPDAVQVLSQVVSSREPEIAGLWQSVMGPGVEADFERIRPLLPALPDVTIKRRMLYSALHVIQLLSTPGSLEQTAFGNLSFSDQKCAVRDLLDFLEGGLAAAQPSER